MSISDMIVVMKLGVIQQIGKPQDVYDNPANLFVAKFLGTPPINVFSGRVQDEKLYIGDAEVLPAKGISDREVYVGVRPEGFALNENGALCCKLNNVEVMGRDVSIVSTNEASLNPVIRSIIYSDTRLDLSGHTEVRYDLKPIKTFIFDKFNDGYRIRKPVRISAFKTAKSIVNRRPGIAVCFSVIQHKRS